jgi:Tfp pilus assembly protein PilF
VVCFYSCSYGECTEILPHMVNSNPIDLVEEAILEFSLGEEEIAENKLLKAVESDHNCLDGWRALAEVRLAMNDINGAHVACEKALRIAPDDLTAKVSLSRILVAKGDKEGAEKATAEARILGWQEELMK